MPSRSTCRGCGPSSALLWPSIRCADSVTAWMTPQPEPARGQASLGRRLLVLLLAPLGVLLVAGLVIDYISSVGPVRGAFDRSLGDAALVVAAYLRPGTLDKIPGQLPPEVS